jgi:hypothetical protein
VKTVVLKEMWGGPLDGQVSESPPSGEDIEVQAPATPTASMLPESPVPAHVRLGVYEFLGIRSRQAGVVWLFEWKGTR